MNPFKVTDAEYNENFGEKKNFLKSLIFQLFKGAEFPTKLEDAVINQTIVEYYEEYFHPFEGFNEEERKANFYLKTRKMASTTSLKKNLKNVMVTNTR